MRAAGIVDNDVHTAKPLLRLGEEPLDVGALRDVGPDCCGSSASMLDAFDYASRARRISRVVDDDGSSVARETKRNGSADSAGGDRDDGNTCGWWRRNRASVSANWRFASALSRADWSC